MSNWQLSSDLVFSLSMGIAGYLVGGAIFDALHKKTWSAAFRLALYVVLMLALIVQDAMLE